MYFHQDVSNTINFAIVQLKLTWNLWWVGLLFGLGYVADGLLWFDAMSNTAKDFYFCCFGCAMVGYWVWLGFLFFVCMGFRLLWWRDLRSQGCWDFVEFQCGTWAWKCGTWCQRGFFLDLVGLFVLWYQVVVGQYQ